MSTDPEITSSLARSRFSNLPRELLFRLTARATDLHVRPGRVLVSASVPEVFCHLIVTGLVRSYMLSSAGRQITVCYSRPGSLLGIATLFASEHTPVGVQVITEARVLSLPPETLRALAATDPRVSHALVHELSERVVVYTNTLNDAVFTSLHDRVLNHLRAIATFDSRDSEASARISQQELADQVGTVREVVVRILREFRSTGLVRTERDRIVLLDTARLPTGSGHDP